MIAAQPRLPWEYQEVEYIESTGTSAGEPCIDTGCTSAGNFKMSSVFMYAQETDPTCASGSCVGNVYSGSAYYFLAPYNGGNFKHGRGAWGTGAANYSSDMRKIGEKQNAIIERSNGQVIFTIDGVSVSLADQNDDPSYSIYLFARNNRNSVELITGQNHFRLYSYDHFQQGEYIRRFVPCYRRLDNKPGMYDLTGSICPQTNSPFYINIGTGSDFIVGPNVN